jgi:hypothetical protein
MKDIRLRYFNDDIACLTEHAVSKKRNLSYSVFLDNISSRKSLHALWLSIVAKTILIDYVFI